MAKSNLIEYLKEYAIRNKLMETETYLGHTVEPNYND
jgi:hypothetical protein